MQTIVCHKTSLTSQVDFFYRQKWGIFWVKFYFSISILMVCRKRDRFAGFQSVTVSLVRHHEKHACRACQQAAVVPLAQRSLLPPLSADRTACVLKPQKRVFQDIMHKLDKYDCGTIPKIRTQRILQQTVELQQQSHFQIGKT